MRYPRLTRRRGAGVPDGACAPDGTPDDRAARLRSRRTAALVAGGALTATAGIGLVSCGSDGSGGADRGDGRANGSGPKLTIVDPYIPQPAKDGIAAGYLVVRNDGDTADRLVAVSSPLTPNAALHETVDTTMAHLDGVDVPAHGRGVLARGAAHIMFTDTPGPLRKGDVVDVTLVFEKSGSVTVRVPVYGIADRPGDPGTETMTVPVAPGGGAASDAGAVDGDPGRAGGHAD
ncbi:copper chaperone PCu(A)C [Yinghuangia sp. ASG 101]|uniref:copper chaperone PCu(A)C n=1 Tax=Yinghuangia sp. ASG 101 TaxID=2896848 RepID=UPI001E464D0C|nr:copper chaperone PCu(A)C [Yinghuangia sp. ASG 101]UGQ15205.1 copper chaperone PCu(A)C [Yinghuangia sp. ASG 101]